MPCLAFPSWGLCERGCTFERVVSDRCLEMGVGPVRIIAFRLIAHLGKLGMGVAVAPELQSVLGALEPVAQVFIVIAEPMEGCFKLLAGVQFVGHRLFLSVGL